MPASKVFTIAPGVPFLETFALALRDNRVLPGFSNPLTLASTIIYVPTRRAGHALIGELGRAFGGPTLLPKIRALGSMEEGEASFFVDDLALSGGLASQIAPSIGTISRRMLLTQLIQKWGLSLTHAIISIDEFGNKTLAEDEAGLVATTIAAAWHLSADLAGLIDELIIEGVDWGKIDGLGDDFDKYWRITTNFLDIAISQWPNVLAGRGQIDAARRQMLFVERQIAMLQNAISPIIILGSTGTNRAVANLMAAVARAPMGAVVLPGLDLCLDAASFAEIGKIDDRGEVHGSTHAQAALARLLPILGVAPKDCVELASVPPALAARMRFASQALRPADTTEQWRGYLDNGGAQDAQQGLAAVTFIEAGDEREEALALAIAMREALERADANIALITPDRALAARVKAELLRWNIEIDDSGGDSLAVSPDGALAQLALAWVISDGAALDQIALLGHELVGFGGARQNIEPLLPLIEMGILRALLPDFPLEEVSAKVDAARENAKDFRAYPAVKRITDEQWEAIEIVLNQLVSALAPLRALQGEVALEDWVRAHRQCLAALHAKTTLPPSASADGLAQFFADLEAASLPDLGFDKTSYQAFIRQLLRETIVRGPQRAHPRLKILGLLEARLLQADVVLLGGLDETIWPPQPSSDAFLNRPMRAKLGLTTPERRVGQTAHDFVQGFGNASIIISHARKRGGSPMVASRFLQRLSALAGAAWHPCVERGARFLALARTLDASPLRRPILRPAPRPPVALRPTHLSVTRIETLRRDPYAIYAEKVLKLVALEPLGIASGAREMGNYIHIILADFTQQNQLGQQLGDASARLLTLAQKHLQNMLANAEFCAFEWPRVQAALEFYLQFERGRRALLGAGSKLFVETKGQLKLQLADGAWFLLSAEADRIEVLNDNTAYIFDYKTGSLPSAEQISAGFSTQLTLEAHILEQGGFAKIGKSAGVSNAAYVKLGGADGGKAPQWLAATSTDLRTLQHQHVAGLIELLDQFRNLEQGYPSRPYPKFVPRYSHYNHLARVAEWSATFVEEDGG